jgi:hypothetical protein
MDRRHNQAAEAQSAAPSISRFRAPEEMALKIEEPRGRSGYDSEESMARPGFGYVNAD